MRTKISPQRYIAGLGLFVMQFTIWMTDIIQGITPEFGKMIYNAMLSIAILLIVIPSTKPKKGACNCSDVNQCEKRCTAKKKFIKNHQ